MHGFLNSWIKVLHPERGAVKPCLAQCYHVVTRQPAWINFYARFNVFRKRKMASNNLPQSSDFVRRKESGRTSAPMKLDHFPARIKQRSHLRHFLFKIIEVNLAV